MSLHSTHVQEDAYGVPATDGIPVSPQVLCECFGVSLQHIHIDQHTCSEYNYS